MSDYKFYDKRDRYSSKFNFQHRRHLRSNSPPRFRYRNQRSHNLKRSPRSSRCIGVFGMSPETTKDTLYKLFVKFGPIERIQMVNFTQTYISRGFCFIYFEKLDDALRAKEETSGLEVDGRCIRVDFAISQREFTPTPGVYKGRPSRPRNSVSWEEGNRCRERSRRHKDYSSSPRSYRSSNRHKQINR